MPTPAEENKSFGGRQRKVVFSDQSELLILTRNLLNFQTDQLDDFIQVSDELFADLYDRSFL